MRESLLGLANSTVQGRPLFGGVTGGARRTTPTGAYVGFGGTTVPAVPVVPVTRQVSDTDAIRVDITGAEAFGDPADGRDLFAVVGDIADHVVSDPDRPDQGDLADLDAALEPAAEGDRRHRHPDQPDRDGQAGQRRPAAERCRAARPTSRTSTWPRR